MGLMRVLDETGDSHVRWSVEDADSVRRARTAFDRCRRSAVAYARPAGGAAVVATPISEFDPTVAEIIFTRPVVAG